MGILHWITTIRPIIIHGVALEPLVGQATRYHAENIMIISFDKDGGVEWSNVIPKTQYDDETDMLISHQILNTGGELHFLFNQYERRTLLLNDQTLGPDGNITRHPTSEKSG